MCFLKNILQSLIELCYLMRKMCCDLSAFCRLYCLCEFPACQWKYIICLFRFIALYCYFAFALYVCAKNNFLFFQKFKSFDACNHKSVRLYFYWVHREKLKEAIKQGNIKVMHMFFICSSTEILDQFSSIYLRKSPIATWLKKIPESFEWNLKYIYP